MVRRARAHSHHRSGVGKSVRNAEAYAACSACHQDDLAAEVERYGQSQRPLHKRKKKCSFLKKRTKKLLFIWVRAEFPGVD
jgi:hypothetical protein